MSTNTHVDALADFVRAQLDGVQLEIDRIDEEIEGKQAMIRTLEETRERLYLRQSLLERCETAVDTLDELL